MDYEVIESRLSLREKIKLIEYQNGVSDLSVFKNADRYNIVLNFTFNSGGIDSNLIYYQDQFLDNDFDKEGITELNIKNPNRFFLALGKLEKRINELKDDKELARYFYNKGFFDFLFNATKLDLQSPEYFFERLYAEMCNSDSVSTLGKALDFGETNLQLIGGVSDGDMESPFEFRAVYNLEGKSISLSNLRYGIMNEETATVYSVQGGKIKGISKFDKIFAEQSYPKLISKIATSILNSEQSSRIKLGLGLDISQGSISEVQVIDALEKLLGADNFYEQIYSGLYVGIIDSLIDLYRKYVVIQKTRSLEWEEAEGNFRFVTNNKLRKIRSGNASKSSLATLLLAIKYFHKIGIRSLRFNLKYLMRESQHHMKAVITSNPALVEVDEDIRKGIINLLSAVGKNVIGTELQVDYQDDVAILRLPDNLNSDNRLILEIYN